MTIKDFTYFPFSLKLKNPFQTSSQVINERNGFIISLTDDSGNVAFGECSPLQGFSEETVEEVENILKELRYRLPGLNVDESVVSISEFPSTFILVSSLQFALEQTLISLMMKRCPSFVGNNFENLKTEISVNAVIGFENTKTILDNIEKKIKLGFNTIKIKVGREYFEDDYNLIENIRNKFGNQIVIRLDANGKWNKKNCHDYLKHLSTFDIQYIEDPVTDIDTICELATDSPIPIAVDEPAKTYEDVRKIIFTSQIEFIILKPMVLGGIISSIRLIKEAGIRDKKIIISSAFESAVGWNALVFIAANTNHSFAHGLDTLDFFVKDICEDGFRIKDGKIFFNPNNFPPQYDFSKL